MKKFVSAISAILVMCSVWTTVSAFEDVSADNQYYDDISYMQDLDIMVGNDHNEFKPDALITQEEFVKALICSVYGNQKEVSEGYYIINGDPSIEGYWQHRWSSWAQPYLNTALDRGIVFEEESKFARQGVLMTRQRAARLIERTFYDLNIPLSTDDYAQHISDWDSLCEYCKPGIIQMLDKGLMELNENGEFRGADNLTRSETAHILTKLCLLAKQ